MNARKLIGVVLSTRIVTLVVVALLLGFIPGVSPRVAMADSVRHFSLLAETMHPIDSSIGYDNTSAFLKTTQDSTISPPTTYIGQLDLPDGARIVSVRCFGLDSDSNSQFNFRLYRYNLWSDPVWSAVTDFAFSGIGFSGGKVMLEANIDHDMAIIDNAEFSYGIFLQLPKALSGDLGLLRCVVDTNNVISLPLIQRN